MTHPTALVWFKRDLRVRDHAPLAVDFHCAVPGVAGGAVGQQDLEKTLAVPAEKSIFNQPLQSTTGPDEWFQK